MRLVIVVVLSAVLSLPSCGDRYAGCSGADGARGIRFEAGLAKERYVESEPVVVSFVLRNDASSRNLAELGAGYTVSWTVRQVIGKKPVPAPIAPSVAEVPADYAWLFPAGGVKSCQADILAVYTSSLPQGDYTVCGQYTSPASVQGVWHGTITTPELSFSVVPAEGVDASAAIAFDEARRSTGGSSSQAKDAAVAFSRLKDPAVGGIFSRYAGIWAAYAYIRMGERKALISELREYVADHSDVPFYGQQAILQLGSALCQDGDYALARTLFDRLPEGYERSKWLARCDSKLTGS